MDWQTYKQQVCAMATTAARVPFTKIAPIDGWEPRVAECHQNVNYWIKLHTGSAAVRGWLAHMPFGNGLLSFTAHSVVRDTDGRLFDITPAAIEGAYRGPFVEHVGDDQSFFEIEKLGLGISCQDGLCAPEVTLEHVLASAEDSDDFDDKGGHLD